MSKCIPSFLQASPPFACGMVKDPMCPPRSQQSSFMDRIEKTRARELAELWGYFINSAWNSFLLNLTPVLVAVLCFATFV